MDTFCSSAGSCVEISSLCDSDQLPFVPQSLLVVVPTVASSRSSFSEISSAYSVETTSSHRHEANSVPRSSMVSCEQ